MIESNERKTIMTRVGKNHQKIDFKSKSNHLKQMI